MPSLFPVAIALSLLTSCSLLEPTDASVTPQRPTVSFDPNTTAHGTFEIEGGFVRSSDENQSLPLSLKYGAGPQTELFLANAPFVRLERPGGIERGPSDLSVGVRHRVLDSDGASPSAAVQAIVQLPTASRSDGLSDGETDAFFAGTVDFGIADATATAFYSLDLLGQVDGSTEVGHTAAFALAQPPSGNFSLFGELAFSVVPDLSTESYLATIGLAHSTEPTTVFDIALVLGLNDEPADWQLVIGLTRNLGRPRR